MSARNAGTRVSVLFAIVLVSAHLAVSAFSQERERRVRSLAEIRHAEVILQEWDSSCGAAALATLLTYDLGDPVKEREVAAAMLRTTGPLRVRVRGGFSLLDMQQYAAARGYEATGYGKLTLEHLVKMLPAIVPVRLHGYDHFIVVRAVRDGKVLVADPAYGRRALLVLEFERAWALRVALVVSREGAQ